jgi:hypothetical protein
MCPLKIAGGHREESYQCTSISICVCFGFKRNWWAMPFSVQILSYTLAKTSFIAAFTVGIMHFRVPKDGTCRSFQSIHNLSVCHYTVHTFQVSHASVIIIKPKHFSRSPRLCIQLLQNITVMNSVTLGGTVPSKKSMVFLLEKCPESFGNQRLLTI